MLKAVGEMNPISVAVGVGHDRGSSGVVTAEPETSHHPPKQLQRLAKCLVGVRLSDHARAVLVCQLVERLDLLLRRVHLLTVPQRMPYEHRLAGIAVGDERIPRGRAARCDAHQAGIHQPLRCLRAQLDPSAESQRFAGEQVEHI